MTPDWQSDCGAVHLYCGDCAEILPHIGKVDAVVTSPPYNMIPKTRASGIYAEHSHKLNNGYESHDDNMTQSEYIDWMNRVVGLCVDCCVGTVWVNHKTRFIDRNASHPCRYLNFPLFSEVIWDRGGSLTLNANRYAPSHEYIFGFGCPVHWNRCNDTAMTVWRINPERNIDGHPCPFPIEIPHRLIESSTAEGHTILDPFMGSGTTGFAAVRLGRKFIGIEKEPKYFEIAKRRIMDALGMPTANQFGETQLRLFQ